MKALIRLSMLLFTLGLGAAVQAEPAIPRLTGPVVDEAHVLSPEDVQALTSYARSIWAAGNGQGIQPQFLLIRSLDGMAIEDYAMRVAEAWKLGTKKDDKGLLFVAAIDDHKVRIEVGGGLEGEVTDVRASRAIREVIAPAFRQGRYGAGFLAGAQALIGSAGSPDSAERDASGGRPVSPLGALVILVLLFGVLGFVIWLGMHSGGGGMGSGWGGGGWGGTSGGGWSGGSSNDSWSGGGGGFSGGGASGDW